MKNKVNDKLILNLSMNWRTWTILKSGFLQLIDIVAELHIVNGWIRNLAAQKQLIDQK